MSTLVALLGVAGIAAVLWHLARAVFRFLGYGASGLWSKEVARTHARRGDVTSLQETEQQRAAAQRRRRRTGVVALGWLALLVAPSFSTWDGPIYASYSVLWLLPVLRRLSTRGSGGRRELE